MKYSLFLAIALVCLALLLVPQKTNSIALEVDQYQLTIEQKVWLGALRWCESRGNDLAVNKMDSDGTPSYGAYQFKPSTYAYFSKKYGLASTTDYMNATQQEYIVGRMLLDKDISDSNLRNSQFPGCIRKLGLPPR